MYLVREFSRFENDITLKLTKQNMGKYVRSIFHKFFGLAPACFGENPTRNTKILTIWITDPQSTGLTTKFARPALLYIYHTRGATGVVGLELQMIKRPVLCNIQYA